MDQRWTVEALDRRLLRPGRNLHAEAAALGVPVEDVVRYTRVRQITLAAGREEMTAGQLRAAGVAAEDLHAYLRVLMRVQQLRTRPTPQRARRLALPAGNRPTTAEPDRQAREQSPPAEPRAERAEGDLRPQPASTVTDGHGDGDGSAQTPPADADTDAAGEGEGGGRALYQGQWLGLTLDAAGAAGLRDALERLVRQPSSALPRERLTMRLPDGRPLALALRLNPAAQQDGATGRGGVDVAGDFVWAADANRVIDLACAPLRLPDPDAGEGGLDEAAARSHDLQTIGAAIAGVAAKWDLAAHELDELRHRAEQAAAATRADRVEAARVRAAELAAQHQRAADRRQAKAAAGRGGMAM